MWFFKKDRHEFKDKANCDYKEESDCKKVLVAESCIKSLLNKVCVLENDLNQLKETQQNQANEILVCKALVESLRIVGTEAKEFIEKFRDMILVGHRLMGYDNDKFPPLGKVKAKDEVKPKKKPTKKKKAKNV